MWFTPLVIRRRLRVLFASLAGLALAAGLVIDAAAPRPADAAGTFPSGFADQIAVAGVQLPTDFAIAADGRMFVAEKVGRVRVVQGGVLLPTPFIDITADVNHSLEFGLVGLALHPQFPTQPYVYVRYVYDPPGATKDVSLARVQRVERITASAANSNVAATGPDARRVLIGGAGDLSAITNPNATSAAGARSCWRNDAVVEDCLPAEGTRHTGAALAFGGDGLLYTTTGDTERLPEGPQSPAQLIGSILRVDADSGLGVPSNPYYNGNPASNLSRVYAHGFRNPFRLSVHPTTGQMIVGDVGEDSVEELNVVQAGRNYGWPCREGTRVFWMETSAACQTKTFTPPVVEWSHTDRGGSVTAGEWYTGTVYPAPYRGAYFYGDYSQRFIRYATADANGVFTEHAFAANLPENSIVALRNGPDGYLYWADLLGNSIHRIAFPGAGNVAPTAVASASTSEGDVPLAVSFRGSDSFDGDGHALTHLWTFGDGASSTVADPTHTYTSVATFTARLTVTDPTGRSDSTTVGLPATLRWSQARHACASSR